VSLLPTEPMSPTVSASLRARYLVANPIGAADFASSGGTPSFIIANSSPFSELKSITIPSQRFPGIVGSFSRRIPSPAERHVTISDENRRAAVPKWGDATAHAFQIVAP